MSEPFPAVYSLLSPEGLLSTVVVSYAIDAPAACRLLYVGVNDTYLVTDAGNRYILRVYRAGWRSRSEIEYELDLIRHLHRKGLSVSVPIACTDGSVVQTLEAPEGRRRAVLFTYADGAIPDSDETHSRLLGRTLARIHVGANDFTSPHNRSHLDLVHLIDRPLQSIRPVLAARMDDWTFLLEMAEQLRSHVQNLLESPLTCVLCHGDFQRKNTRVDEDRTVTVFDFDHCGPGWLAYDLAVFRPVNLDEGNSARIWESFLAGYTDQKTISDADLAAVTVFGALIRLQTLALYAEHRDKSLWASDAINDGLFDRELAFLRAWGSG